MFDFCLYYLSDKGKGYLKSGSFCNFQTSRRLEIPERRRRFYKIISKKNQESRVLTSSR